MPQYEQLLPIKNEIKVLDKALNTVSDALEQEASNALKSYSLKYPEANVCFISAMGIYTFEVDEQEADDQFPKIISLFDSVQTDYGFGPIPAPIWLSAKNGVVVTKKSEW